MQNNFKKAQELELTANDRQAIKGLKDSKEWQLTKDLLESWVLKLNANSLTGHEIEKGIALEEFSELRSFVQKWKRFVMLVEKKQDE